MIKASGYVDAGGLGNFDPSVYEEIEGDLPKGSSNETVKTTEELFQEQIQLLPVENRQDAYVAKLALDYGDKATALFIVQNMAVLDNQKTKLLEVLL